MRKGFLGSLAVLAAGAGLTFGQYPPPPGAMPGPLPGTLPPAGEIAGNPPPGVAPGAYAGPSGAAAGYMYTSPDGHPVIMPPGLEGMVPPGAMGAGAPGGVYDEGGNGYGRGLLGGLFGGGRPRFWFGGEYLLWVPKSMNVNYPLATTSAPADLGILGRATTVAIPGAGDDITFDAANGFRAWVGSSWDESGMFGGEVSGLWLTRRGAQNSFPGNGGGLPVLAVPFWDVNAGAPGSYLVSFPGITAGTIKFDAKTRVIGGEANLVFNMNPGADEPGGVTLLAGLRFFQLEESFNYATSSTTFGVPPGGIVPPGTLPPPASGSSFFPAAGGVFAGTFFGPALAPYTVTTTDSIRTFNDFYGANVGFRGDVGWGGWFLQATGKFAAGYMRQWIDVIGYSTLTANTNLTSTQPGGFFNIPNDLGRHHRDRFAILPEGGLTVGYQFRSWLRLSAGYTYIYTNTVLRPTSSINPVANPNLIPVSPAFSGTAPSIFIPRDVTRDTDFHIHGFTAGVQISF
jgi:hypothetical protein